MCLLLTSDSSSFLRHMGFLCVSELSINAMLMGKDCAGTSVLSLLGPFYSATNIKMIRAEPLFIICERKPETFSSKSRE